MDAIHYFFPSDGIRSDITGKIIKSFSTDGVVATVMLEDIRNFTSSRIILKSVVDEDEDKNYVQPRGTIPYNQIPALVAAKLEVNPDLKVILGDPGCCKLLTCAELDPKSISIDMSKEFDISSKRIRWVVCQRIRLLLFIYWSTSS